MKTPILPTNIKKLIRILNNSEFHSGTALGQELDLTRSGIWKLIKQLEGLGVEIESITNKGYRLIKPIELLDKAKIKSYISTAHQSYLHKLHIKNAIPSTNLFLLDIAKETNNENIACLAEQQTAGRGRLGRKWVSPFAENIYLSLLWHFPCHISELAGLNIVIGATIAEAIQICTKKTDIQLKWPNDIYLDDAKAGGVLIEMIAEHHGSSKVVIGIGLNLNMSSNQTGKIQKPWTNLATPTSPISRNMLTGMLLDKLIANLQIYMETGMDSFLKTWTACDYLKGKSITISQADQTIKGIAQGVDKDGHLRLKIDSGKIINIATGDASVLFE